MAAVAAAVEQAQPPLEAAFQEGRGVDSSCSGDGSGVRLLLLLLLLPQMEIDIACFLWSH